MNGATRAMTGRGTATRRNTNISTSTQTLNETESRKLWVTPRRCRTSGSDPKPLLTRSSACATASEFVAVMAVPLTLSTTTGKLVDVFTKARIIGR